MDTNWPEMTDVADLNMRAVAFSVWAGMFGPVPDGFPDLPDYWFDAARYPQLPAWLEQAVKATNWHAEYLLIGSESDPYMERWSVEDDDGRSVKVHHFHRSDAGVILPDGSHDPLAMHDHPVDFVSILISGAYRDHALDGTHRDYRAGDVVRHAATDAHRLELLEGRVWSVVLTGPKVRPWGFHTRAGWFPWRDLPDTAPPAQRG